MARRNRLTWRDRQASPPPATPGYGTEENTSHPAYYEDPGAHDYENGDTSSWAEDPHPGPYVNSAAPATPGYGTEDQDHPAKKRASIRDLILARSAKALRMASAMLGPKAPRHAIDDQALDLMDLDDRTFESTYRRIARSKGAGGFFAAEDDDLMGCDGEGPMGCSGVMGQGEEVIEPMGGRWSQDEEDEDEAMEEEEAMLAQMLEEDVVVPMAGRRSQDEIVDVEEDIMGMYGLDEEAEDDEEEAMDDLFGMFPKAAARKLGFDDNGFALKKEWRGKKALFDELDTDGDGIISIREFNASMYGMEEEEAGNDLYGELDEEEMAMLRALEDEEAEDVDDEAAMILAGLKKKDEKKGEEEDEKKGLKKDKEKKAKKDEKKGEGEEEDEADESDKEASDAGIFSMAGDPMGLSGSPTLSEEEDALLSEIFDTKTAADDDDDDEGEEEEDEGEEEEEKEAVKKKASRTASQRPRPRKPGKGPKSLGSVTRTASSAGGEVAELEKLWDSAPNVDDVFGM